MGRKSAARRLDTRGLWAAAAVVLVAALCVVAGWADRLSLPLYDAATPVSAPAPLAEITIVGIDDASLAALGPLPWSREVHAQAIDRLSAAGAKTIVYLPHFLRPESTAGLAQVRKIRSALAGSGDASPLATELARLAADADAAMDADARLASSILKAGNVLLASQYGVSGKPAPLPPYVRRSALTDPGEHTPPAHAAQHPMPAIGAAAAGVGHWVTPEDPDGAVRQVRLVLRDDGVGVASLALLATRHSLHLGADEMRWQATPSAVRLGGVVIPTDDRAMVRPRVHAAPAGAPSVFTSVSFAAVLHGKVPATALQDKLVLVGATTDAEPGASIPTGHAQPMPTVEWLAHSVSAMRQGLTIQVPGWSGPAMWLCVALVALFFGLAAPRLSLAAGLGIGAAMAVALAGTEWVLLRYAGQWVPLLGASAGALAGTAVLAARRLQGPSVRDAAASAEAAETDRMMGLALHGQGQLDMAFDRLRKVPPSDALMENLYHLAQDFERKRNFAQAKAAYGHILRHDRDYKDAKSRYKRVRAHLQQGADSRSPAAPSSLPPHHSEPPRLPGDASVGIPMLGRYQIEKELGKGAMGVVYQGRDPKIGRIVAIKTLALSQEFEGSALVDARSRFFREAETAGRLQHPHIVTIFDAGEEHDLAYIAMEFLKGTDLAAACRKDHLLPVATVLSIAARVADALDYAHTHNVVHRDIKPANIMFDSGSDTVKVTDFGIARITDSSKTRTGLVLGTPSFMSPEQLAGKKVDGRTDLYALGVTLFQLLTGTLPLRGESMTELMHKIATVEPPDIRQIRPEISGAVANVVALALKKRPEARYQTGRQFAADLRQAAGAAPTELEAPKAVVYDADRDATGHEMADFQETVMDPPAVRGTAPPPPSGAR
ncbi:CHASE2 domain-containing serine/threonine-protein kinase [Paracidovorax sp. MALMAid1276]|uniref:CHASE2 domain-containing serine/threonine-protein kinase n=1 Tax=Paracidovorax sp. MALMAid1276 TaxID=3411631 RepID=UPI003B9B5E2A